MSISTTTTDLQQVVDVLDVVHDTLMSVGSGDNDLHSDVEETLEYLLVSLGEHREPFRVGEEQTCRHNL